MNFKKFHESKNLFLQKLTGVTIASSGEIVSDVNYGTYIAEVSDGKTYTISNVTGTQVFGFFTTKPTLGSITYNSSRTIFSTSSQTLTVPTGENIKYIGVRYNTGVSNAMFNTGSTPQPYEPYSSEVWHDTPHYIHNTSTDTITTLPAVLYPNAATATVGLKGNMSQTGTPTPQTPIQPQETGERTGNLLHEFYAASGEISGNSYTITKNSIETHNDGSVLGSWYVLAEFKRCGNYANYTPIDEKHSFKIPAGTYTFSANENIHSGYNGLLLIVGQLGQTVAGATGGAKNIGVGQTFTVDVDSYVCPALEIRYDARVDEYILANPMLNSGSTPLPYEPYGYKIPISSASTTTPVYLGEVETTRQIKKLVLTGEETVAGSAVTGGWIVTNLSDNINNTVEVQTAYCSHFLAKNNGAMSSLSQGEMCINTQANNRINFATTFATVADLKSYLAAQYAAGTPVTVWYVLATEETGIVNEPLRKIGDYADTVSGITIPTIAGANTLSVGTTLQPSEVTATYKGWHPVADVHVYPDSSWMPTSWEEFRKAVRSGKAQSLYPIGTKLYENWGDTTSDAWIVVDYPTGEDYLDSDLAQQGYINRVMLMEEKLNYLRQFDAIEAWLYVETAIPAGTYRFTIPNYDTTHGGNKTYIFTSTANVPVSGQLTLTWAYNTNPTKVQGYSSSTSTTALFDVNIAEWDGTTACTDLGTIKLAIADADSTYGKLNHIHRARYGSNNYYQSGLRQWLNADATANNWWTPSNIFDRPYDNRNTAGRLNALNSNMKAVLATPTVNCITNNLFEYPSLDGTTFSLQTAYTVKDKLFLVTHTETNLSSTPNVDSVLAYYTNAQNADRIKYRKDNGNAYYWWLRTPTPTSAFYVRSVYTSGALTTSLANSTVGSAAACIIQ